MIVRREQLSVFEARLRRQFTQDMVAHLRKFAPRHADALGESGLLEVIDLGIHNAEGHGFTLRGTVRFYLEMMFLFGSYFDSDAQYPWVEPALSASPRTLQMMRADDLHKRALDYLHAVRGPDNLLLFDALHRLRDLASVRVPDSSEDLMPELAGRLALIYPAKCEFIGRDALLELLNASAERAILSGMQEPLGQALFAILGFELGHRFDRDPLYAWAGHIIRSASMGDGNRRAERLRDAAIRYLDGALRAAPPAVGS